MRRDSKRFCLGVLLALSICLIFAPFSYGGFLKEDYKSRSLAGRTRDGGTTSGVYDPTDPYSVLIGSSGAGGVGCSTSGPTPAVANLNPLKPKELSGTTANFIDVLIKAFPITAGWSYKQSTVPLSEASLVVHTYDVQGTPTRVGAEFDVEYVPHGSDPKSNVHWIQVVKDNHAIPGKHGDPENEVDNPFSPGGRSPYYDDGGAADGSNFYDFPGRCDADLSHDWLAQLFLVTGPAVGTPGNITFYGGIAWGWENHIVPEPSTLTLFGVGILGFSVYGWRRRVCWLSWTWFSAGVPLILRKVAN